MLCLLVFHIPSTAGESASSRYHSCLLRFLRFLTFFSMWIYPCFRQQRLLLRCKDAKTGPHIFMNQPRHTRSGSMSRGKQGGRKRGRSRFSAKRGRSISRVKQGGRKQGRSRSSVKRGRSMSRVRRERRKRGRSRSSAKRGRSMAKQFRKRGEAGSEARQVQVQGKARQVLGKAR